MLKFSKLEHHGNARRGRIELARGVIETPVFMPIGTMGAVKTVEPRDLEQIDTRILLGNTLHLMLRPGLEVIELHGGLHEFMGWNRPILTDSGGFQVFSLPKLRQIEDRGVTFRSPVNGDKVFMGPEESIHVQRVLNSDIAMIFDDCTPYPATHEEAKCSMERSVSWARRSKRAHDGATGNLFGIIQGGMHPDLREISLNSLTEIRIRRICNWRLVGRGAERGDESNPQKHRSSNAAELSKILNGSRHSAGHCVWGCLWCRHV